MSCSRFREAAPQRWTSAMAVVMVICASAHADERLVSGGAGHSVLVLNLEDGIGNEPTTAELSGLLRDELSDFLGARLRRPEPDQSESAQRACGAHELVTCAVSRAQMAGADWVLGGTVDDEPALASIELWLVDARSRELRRRLRDRLGSDRSRWPSHLQGIGIQLLDPEAYVGELLVSELQALDRIFIDGGEVPVRPPEMRITLPVGPHAVEVERVGGVLTQASVQIAFGETAELPPLEVPAPVTQPSTSPPVAHQQEAEDRPWSAPPWLSVAALGAGATGLLVGAGMIIYAMSVLEPEREYAEGRDTSGAACPATETGCWSRRADSLETAVAVLIGSGIAVGVAAVMAVGAGTFLMIEQSEPLVPSTDGEETPPGSAALDSRGAERGSSR